MRKLGGIAIAACAAAWSSQALAVHAEDYRIPYFGAAGLLGQTDSARKSGDLQGFELTVGVPLGDPTRALELHFFDAAIRDRYARGTYDHNKDYQSGLLLDYVYDFSAKGTRQDGFFRYAKPFVNAGVGFVQEDVNHDKKVHLAASLGAGVIAPIGWHGIALRLDGRLQPQSNSESVSVGNGYASDKSLLVDYVLNLGIQVPLTIFFDRPVPVAPAQDCPVAVVDPRSGRRDCAGDSDGDGVIDPKDQCPGTAAGTIVDEQGCPKVERQASDADGDGVPDARDTCPGTDPALQVDDKGCVVAQRTAVKGVTFEENSAKLTAEGRKTLDSVAATLKQQPGLKVEIAGHTDSVGSDAYNQLLSQQRADAVKDYLAQAGIAAERMNAAGYGETEPVASNDTDAGRNANRRVEFRITASN